MSRIVIPAKLPGETVSVTFDFISKLAIGETISTKVTTCTVYSGFDIAPSALISGSASSSGTVVTQLISGGVLGVIYLLLCTITTSAGQTRSLSAFLAVVPNIT